MGRGRPGAPRDAAVSVRRPGRCLPGRLRAGGASARPAVPGRASGRGAADRAARGWGSAAPVRAAQPSEPLGAAWPCAAPPPRPGGPGCLLALAGKRPSPSEAPARCPCPGRCRAPAAAAPSASARRRSGATSRTGSCGSWRGGGGGARRLSTGEERAVPGARRHDSSEGFDGLEEQQGVQRS